MLSVDRPAALDPKHALAPANIRYDMLACRFANRCPAVHPICRSERPPAVPMGERQVYCYKYVEGAFAESLPDEAPPNTVEK